MTPSLARYIVPLVRWLLPAFVVSIVLLGAGGVATSHDIHAARTPTEEAVFHFYATWMRPPDRTMSCCSMQDCHVVQIKKEDGLWYFKDDLFAHAWRQIPAGRLEQNTGDPRESPDGQSHACFNSMYILCVVLGSGQ